jgi:type VI secretion system protein ImpM
MAGCGFYGKIPSEGDFVTRRLPWEFTSAWDDWLQQGMQASRETLGERWLELYLSAPIWRFQIAPGVCGPLGWRGLFFASVDRVGRYFPLTLAFADGGAPALATLSGDAEPWLCAEDAALEALAPTLPIDAFDRLVEALVIPGGVPTPASSAEPARVRFCLYTLGSEDVAATGLSFDALPPPDAFVELLAPSATPPPAGSLTDLLGA